jgi:hypothetical protein
MMQRPLSSPAPILRQVAQAAIDACIKNPAQAWVSLGERTQKTLLTVLRGSYLRTTLDWNFLLSQRYFLDESSFTLQ